MKITLKVFLSLLMFAEVTRAQVKQQFIKIDQILTVKAALGIATIIQIPEPIQSAIIGDQSAFKVEYLDKAVTIKPLRYGAKTNLYLVTDKRRYNVRLVTVPQEGADYIVYVKSSESAPTTRWKEINRMTSSKVLKLSISRVGQSTESFILLDGKIATDSVSPLTLKPSDVCVLQSGESKAINGLFLSDLTVAKDKPVLVGISLAKSDFIPKKPITIEIRGQEKLSVTLPEALLWQ